MLVQTAPYTAAAQIVQLERDNFVHAVAGSADLFVFGAERVITNFDWDSKRISWVELKSCLGKTLLQRDQFVDLMLLSGCSFIPAIPEAEQEADVSRISAARSLMSRFGHDGHTACQQLKDEDYLAAFRKAKYVVKHPVVMSADGKIEPKNSDALPNDTHDFVGQRLPDEVYFYLTRGLVGPRVLNWRTRLQIFETPPLDGGSSQSYKDLVQEKLRPLRAQALTLLTRPLHRYYQKVDVDLLCWFNEGDKRPLGIPGQADSPGRLSADTWRAKEDDLPSPDDNALGRPLTFALTILADDDLAKKTLTAQAETSKRTLSSHKELLSNTIFRFLHGRGYVNEDHTLSAWGKALKAALDHAYSTSSIKSESLHPTAETEEAILMAFELLRLDVLSSKKMFQSPPYSGAPIRGSDTDKANTLLISRVACLGTFQHKVSRCESLYTSIALAQRELIELGNLELTETGKRLYGTLVKALVGLPPDGGRRAKQPS